jgi:endoglycosylceramidase
VDGIRDAFGHFWGNVSKTFKDFDSVLGYEIINEPFMGHVWLNPLELISGYTDKHIL